jgi:hypothetical protein
MRARRCGTPKMMVKMPKGQNRRFTQRGASVQLYPHLSSMAKRVQNAIMDIVKLAYKASVRSGLILEESVDESIEVEVDTDIIGLSGATVS